MLAKVAPAVNQLSEDEELLRLSVRSFAVREVAPQVRAMEERGVIPRALIDQLFELGVVDA